MSTITRMLPALKILRDRGIVHRDIKLENVKLSRTDDTAIQPVLQAAGLGPCRPGAQQWRAALPAWRHCGEYGAGVPDPAELRGAHGSGLVSDSVVLDFNGMEGEAA